MLIEPVIERKYDSILVITDRLIKYTYILLYIELSIVEELAYTFLRIVVANYRILDEIISDRDRLFISKF